MSIVLEIKNLTKRYGKFTAVNDLSLTVESGQIFGILGPNGSGKTTTLGMVLDVINTTEGSYVWFEQPGVNHRRRIGAILEHPIFYPDLSGLRNLEIVALIKNVSKDNIQRVLERVGLWERKDSAFKTYSLGMKQRLSLASALLSDPEVLVLDEPTNGLDPQGINQMRELILSIAKEGKTIIISSHLLDEIQKMCSHYAILKNGVLLTQGSIEEIIKAKNSFILSAKKEEDLKLAISSHPNLTTINMLNDKMLVAFNQSITGGEINAFCFEKGIVLEEIIEHRSTLEEEFLQIVK